MLARYMSEEGAAAYSRKYERTLLRRLSNRRELAIVERALDRLGATGEMLDVPCGAGRVTPVLLGRATTLVGVDVSPAMLEIAARALATQVAAGRVRLVCASASALPFPDGSFDTAVCWRLLHHLTDPTVRLRALGELRRVARRGVVVSFADAGTLKRRLRAWRRRARRTTALTVDQLAAEAAQAGLALDRTWRLSSAFSHLGAATLRPT